MVGAGALEIEFKNLKKWSKIVFILLELHEFSNDVFHVCPWNKKINRLKNLKVDVLDRIGKITSSIWNI